MLNVVFGPKNGAEFISQITLQIKFQKEKKQMIMSWYDLVGCTAKAAATDISPINLYINKITKSR